MKSDQLMRFGLLLEQYIQEYSTLLNPNSTTIKELDDYVNSARRKQEQK
jgi:hypothetical protein